MHILTDFLKEAIIYSNHEPLQYRGEASHTGCISYHTENVIGSIVTIVTVLMEREAGSEGEREDIWSLIEKIKGAQTDQLGQYQIVYFPDCEWVN